MTSIIERDESTWRAGVAATLWIVTIFTFLFGSIMVLSASSIELMEADKMPVYEFFKQLTFGIVGLVMMWLCSRIPIKVYERIATPALLITDAMLVGVLVLGKGVNGNNNWLPIFGFQFQPSEFAKLVLCIWLGIRLANCAQGGEIRSWKAVFNRENLLAIVGTLGLILAGGDLGTVLIFCVMLFGQLYIAGVPKRWLFLIAGIGAAGVAALTLPSANRMTRIFGVYTCGLSTDDLCYQPTHGLYALGTGGLTGVGPGASREKWSYLPEADNDFIFAVIGEELGFIGALIVICAYIVLAVALIVLMKRVADTRALVVTSGILAWVGGQAIVNIGAVLHFLPAIGVPLPLISSGGTSLIATMAAMGVALSFARARNFNIAPKNLRGIKTVVAK